MIRPPSGDLDSCWDLLAWLRAHGKTDGTPLRWFTHAKDARSRELWLPWIYELESAGLITTRGGLVKIAKTRQATPSDEPSTAAA